MRRDLTLTDLRMLNHKLNQYAPCVIAGGAVRDACLGKTIRDVDIYCDEDDFAQLVYILGGGNLDIHYPDNDSAEYMHQSVRAQIEFETDWYLGFSWLPNVIGIDKHLVLSGEEIVSRFNIGLSQYYLDGDEVVASDNAQNDVESKTITCLREAWGSEGTIKTMYKLVAKYYTFAPVFEDGTPWTATEQRLREAGYTNAEVIF